MNYYYSLSCYGFVITLFIGASIFSVQICPIPKPNAIICGLHLGS